VTLSGLNPDDATQVDEARRLLVVVGVAAAVFGLMEIVAGLTLGSPRALSSGLVFAGHAAWLAALRRRGLGRRPVASVLALAATALIVLSVVVVVLQPFLAGIVPLALLLPVSAALPFLGGHVLRRLMVVVWVGIAAALAASYLPDDAAIPAVAREIIAGSGLVLLSGLVLFLLYRSAARLTASSREFGQLFQLSSDLAETAEPAVLGELIARHLSEATGFDDCVIYALVPDTDRLTPFGSHPIGRSLEATPESYAARPALGRAIHDRAPIVVDVADEHADPVEVERLRARGQAVMLLLPLVALAQPVGVAKLTASARRPLGERQRALARTLAFEAAIAIENGRLYRELHHLALHDPLTGLANRSLFHDRVEHALARLTRREGMMIALLFIDLDDFKAVNDTLGHAQGDRLLVLVAELLRTASRPGDTVARFGGDEFALLLEDLTSGDEALVVAERIVAATAAPFHLAGRQVMASVSIGVALRSAGGRTAADFLGEADAAMYAAKRAGKGRAVLLGPGLGESPKSGDHVAAVARSHSFDSTGLAPEGQPADAAEDEAS
jgi:diguanylate cyclase (GGDEF)-like protein